jgi:hypothetical protein
MNGLEIEKGFCIFLRGIYSTAALEHGTRDGFFYLFYIMFLI